MARPRGSSEPRGGSEQIAAAVALYGNERTAAARLGISRGTIHGILSGRQGVGAKTSAALAASADRDRIGTVAGSLSAGRTRAETVQAARTASRQERRTPGSTEQQARAHAANMRAQGLDVYGQQLYDSAGRKITPAREQSWETLQARYQSGELDMNQDRYLKARARLDAATEDQEIEMMGEVGDEEFDEDMEEDAWDLLE